MTVCADAQRLAELLRPVKAKINLIPFNEHAASDLSGPDPSWSQPVPGNPAPNVTTPPSSATARASDICAACGQLRANLKSENG